MAKICRAIFISKLAVVQLIILLINTCNYQFKIRPCI